MDQEDRLLPELRDLSKAVAAFEVDGGDAAAEFRAFYSVLDVDDRAALQFLSYVKWGSVKDALVKAGLDSELRPCLLAARSNLPVLAEDEGLALLYRNRLGAVRSRSRYDPKPGRLYVQLFLFDVTRTKLLAEIDEDCLELGEDVAEMLNHVRLCLEQGRDRGIDLSRYKSGLQELTDLIVEYSSAIRELAENLPERTSET